MGGNILLDRRDQVQQVLSSHAINLKLHRPAAVEIADLIGVFETIDYSRNIRQVHLGPVVLCENDNFFKVRPAIPLALGANQDFSACGFDRAARQVQRSISHRIGDIRETHAVST